MAIKYTCPKCNRRFADWGAQKLGFKCPHDENCPPGTEDEIIELLRVGAPVDDAVAVKPTLKRKKTAAVGIVQETDLLTDGDDLDVVDDLDPELDEEEDDIEKDVKSLPVKRKIKVSTDDASDDEDDDAEEEVEALDFEEVEGNELAEGFVEVDDES